MRGIESAHAFALVGSGFSDAVRIRFLLGCLSSVETSAYCQDFVVSEP